jgi:hypothetical protein
VSDVVQLSLITSPHFPRERSAACAVLNPVTPHAARATHGSYRNQGIASKPLRRMTSSRTSVGPFGLSCLAEIGLLTKGLDVLARQFSRTCNRGGTAEVTHRDLVAGNVGQKTAGVHVTRRFQQLQGQAGVALCHPCCPGLFAGRHRPLFRALC